MSYGTCKRCGRAVFWLQNASTGKTAPIDAEPTIAPRSGNVVIDHEARTYRVVAAAPGLFVSHFATCPAARKFRRSRPASRSARGSGGKRRQP